MLVKKDHVVSATVANTLGMSVENIVKFVTERKMFVKVVESRLEYWF